MTLELGRHSPASLRAAPGRPGKADLHVHTADGDGMATIPELLAHIADHTDLDLVAVTDHDDIGAAHRARDLAMQQGLPFEVVVGMEVTTLGGHLLALFVEEPIPSLRSLPRTIDMIHRRGGLCIVPHPLSWLTRSVGRNGLERLYVRRESGTWLDGLEVANQSPAGRVTQARAQRLNRERYELPETGGSDAHFLSAVGSGYTAFPGRTAADLRRAIESGAVTAERAFHPRLGELGYHRLLYQQLRSWTVTPRRVVGRPLLGLLHRIAGR